MTWANGTTGRPPEPNWSVAPTLSVGGETVGTIVSGSMTMKSTVIASSGPTLRPGRFTASGTFSLPPKSKNRKAKRAAGAIARRRRRR